MPSANIFAFTDTWNSGATTFNGIQIDVTNTASAAASRLINLKVGGVTMFDVSPTGVLTTVTAAADTNTTQAASTAFVIGQGYAKLASPPLTGTPTAPTAAAGTNTTQIASTAYVRAEKLLTINDQVGTTYTFALTDNGALVRCSNASAITVTVPLNSTIALPIGSQILVSQAGAGRVTLSPAGGVTLNNSLSLSSRAQYSILALIKTGTDTWVVFGDML